MGGTEGRVVDGGDESGESAHRDQTVEDVQHFGDDRQRADRVAQRDGVDGLQDDGETELAALRHVIGGRLRLSVGVRVVTDVRIRLTARYRHLKTSYHEI